ncbi:hypothetical protein C2E21_5847 [Chlorella sorokiniana]|uniref:Uncharacterized protein n=1 Tax=Chlorella sorokiniana TaxID=3076 RepID=A0A2P6TMJ9_CHLSO|nr:hypothetical protein C2E21_5847 [Chlorella sorokiniana]|eukprot:PRW45552.1 hypothetical protein C2E21_5847 [Chlorella sorokiniana]
MLSRTLLVALLLSLVAAAAAGGAPPPRRCRVCDRSWDINYPVVNGRYKDIVPGQFVEKAFNIVLREVKSDARAEHCKVVSVRRHRACYESIVAKGGKQFIGAYGFEFSVKLVCEGIHRPVYKKVLAETLNKRHSPHLIKGEITYL